MKKKEFLNKVGVSSLNEAYQLFLKKCIIKDKDIISEIRLVEIFEEKQLEEILTKGYIKE